jgi:formate hydrogenlyase subunit 4
MPITLISPEIDPIIFFVIALIGFGILGPIVGCLLAGIDRKINARMQSRVGPPLLQPYYDVRKLLAKENRNVNDFQGFYILLSLIFAIVSGAMFFAGLNFLMVIFLITLSSLFFIVAAYSTRSPYAEVGAEREIIQVLSYEPMIIITAVFFFVGVVVDKFWSSGVFSIQNGSFDISAVLELEHPLITTVPLIFIGLLFILTIKLRKSPFDLSYSHHAHQELVKGISTEMSGRTLALVEITHWYESVLFMGYVGLFFVWGNPLSIIAVIVAVVLVYFFEIVIDNSFARVKWQAMLKWSWIVTLVLSVITIAIVLIIPTLVQVV